MKNLITTLALTVSIAIPAVALAGTNDRKQPSNVVVATASPVAQMQAAPTHEQYAMQTQPIAKKDVPGYMKQANDTALARIQAQVNQLGAKQ